MTHPGRLALAIATATATAGLGAPRAAAGEGKGEASARVMGLVWGAGDQEPAFFGSSGQIYEPKDSELEDSEPIWTRRSPGGVATEVRAVLRAPSGALFAAGARTPLFRREQNVWYTHALQNRGGARLAHGGDVPALGVGRHLYLLQDDTWNRIGRAPDDIAAIWASARRRIYVATRSAKIYRGRAGRFAEIAHPLPDDDPIKMLVGRPGDELYAVAESDTVLEVGARRARKAEIPDTLSPSRIDAAGYLPDGTPALAMAMPSESDEASAGEDAPSDADASAPLEEDATARAALVALRDGKASIVAMLPRLAPGDRVAAIAARKGEPMIATRRGMIAIREGETWRSGRVSDALPEDSAQRREGASPARSP